MRLFTISQLFLFKPPKMKLAKKTLVLELVLFFSIPLFAICSYVSFYHKPVFAIFQHLYVVGLLFLSIISLKILLQRLIKSQIITYFLTVHIYALTIFFLCVYYVLLFIGLNSWHKVITEEFIVAYASQANNFAQVLGVSLILIVALLVLVYLLIAVICHLILKKINWQLPKVTISNKLPNLLIFVLFLFFSYWLNHHLSSSHGNSKEPFYLTMSSGKSNSQNHTANQGGIANNRLNQLEQAARQKYVINKLAKRKNIVIILVDALRPDHMSLYGYSRDTTPYLKALEQKGLAKKMLFANSTCAETTCAHASFFGSRYIHKLPNNLFTLQEVLKKYDYSSHFMISGDHVNFYNIRDIYGKVDNYYDGSMQKKYFFNDDALVIEKTKSLPIWDGKPAMFHYHLLSSHNVGKKQDKFLQFKPYKNYAGVLNSLPKSEYINFYDNGVLQTDSVIQTLIETLKSKNYLQDALVVVMADHGDSLGEHGLMNHTNSVYQQPLHIPLVFIPFGYQTSIANNTNKFISIADIAPTILQEFDIPLPNTWVGNSIQNNQQTKISYFQMLPFNGFYDLTDDKNIWKYWQNENTLEEYAFNLSKDPKEENNLFVALPSEQKQKMRALLPKVQY